MIEVEGLTKYYGRLPAVKDVSFRVDSGEIVGFLGPNGAGKTTTMRIITCFSPPSAGSAKVLGMDVRTDSLQIRRKIGYVPENVPLYDWMRVKSYLGFVARAKGVAASERSGEVGRVAAAVGLEDVTNKLIRWLSKGYRQRVGLAQALIGNPPVLVLDEPTIGLDPRQIRDVRQLIRGFARDHTVILSTHILPEVSQVCDRVVIINRGTIVAEGAPSELTRSRGQVSRCAVAVRAPEQEVKALIEGLEGVTSVRAQTTEGTDRVEAVVDAAPEVEIAPLLARAVLGRNWDLLELKPWTASLEDVFIELVTEETEDPPSEPSDRKEVA